MLDYAFSQFDEYYVVAPGSDYGEVLFSDIRELPNATVFHGPIAPTTWLINTFHHIHFSFRINGIMQLPFQKIWRKHYSLSFVDFEKEKKYCVIFSDVSACRTDIGFLYNLKQKENVVLVLYMVNIAKRKQKVISRRMPCFDYIFTYDSEDAKKHNWIYHPLTYSKTKNLNNKKEEIVTDAFFVGMASGRQEKIETIYKQIVDSGGIADFYISGVPKNKKNQKGIHYNHWLSYAEVLEHIIRTNCIIEVVIEGEVGGTMRMQEAICLNKKLFSTNEWLLHSDLFDKRYMCVSSNIESIDVGFILSRESVNYSYHGKYSPINLINHINCVCSGVEYTPFDNLY